MKPPEEEELFMKEIIELKERLQKKRDKLSGSEGYAQGEINNVHVRIGDFERWHILGSDQGNYLKL